MCGLSLSVPADPVAPEGALPARRGLLVWLAPRSVGAILSVLSLAVATMALGADAPHDAAHGMSCASCHLEPATPAGDIESSGGNANLCQSCHVAGGAAAAQARHQADQAQTGPWLPTNLLARGTSHRWDGNPMGRLIFLGGAATHSTGSILPSGVYTGRYARTYTLTIIIGGEPGYARFNWTASPGGGGASNVVAGYDVALSDGVRVSFYGSEQPPSFRGGDRWQLLVRPDLDMPSDPEMLWRMTDGFMGCSTCHDPHSQELAPFDPGAPGSGAGRHFQRLDNRQDGLCRECHGARFVSSAAAGSHPVGIGVATNGFLRRPASLPLDAEAGAMWCSTCHTPHNSPVADGSLLRTADPTALCEECHTLADTATPGSHFTRENATLWPGGQYGSQYPAVTGAAQRGSCANCHQVHGWPNASMPSGDYPGLLVEREENLCYTCHDGSPVSKNLRANFAKTYTHPVVLGGRHSPAEEGDPARYGATNRHAECADCHNPHRSAPDLAAPAPPLAPNALRGVSRVSVQNLTSNLVSYTFRNAADPAPVKEYEVCFKCHSGWTTRPSGQADYALKFNTLAASFHPVEGPGKNLNINPNAFVNGWNASRLTYCTDCHTSDDPAIRGSHGSTNRYLLKKVGIASPARRSTAMSRDEICFDCHNYDTYANNNASDTVRNYSRFGGGNGHRRHSGGQRYPCYACHDSHGSTTLPNLLVLGRSPGLTSYTRTANGGTCTATCHGSENYTVAYPR